MVVCFYFEWFGSQICPQREFLTSISPHKLDLQNGVLSLQCISDNQGLVLEDDSSQGCFWVPCFPAGSSQEALMALTPDLFSPSVYYFSLHRCAKNRDVKLYQGEKVYPSTKSRDRERGEEKTKNLMKSKFKASAYYKAVNSKYFGQRQNMCVSRRNSCCTPA